MDLDKIGKFIALNRKNKGLTQEKEKKNSNLYL